MYEKWKTRTTFMDHVNILTKMIVGVLLFFFVIFIHRFDVMLYMAIMMFLFMLIFSGTEIKVVLTLFSIIALFSVTSSLFMIFYGDGIHTLFKWGIIHITTESLFRGLHLSLRTIMVSALGLTIAFTTQVVMIFYSLMQHLKVKPKYAYAFMAAIRMVPLMIESFFQLRNSLKMRYEMIDSSQYRGFKRIKHLLIPLMSQNIRKAHRLAVAMEKKGFKEGPRTYYYYVPFSFYDLIFLAVIAILVFSAFLMADYWPVTALNDVR
ncbi:energy-coupling factor transporter transmembrane protein EcfT [Macrococcus hajekii]|uniref:Energy-coupling factor transporter transmembrane protein EcfT n=1 Tax=Macrococcus hajekii TaxID=198482 RepID=A0A4V3BDZ1_9STAP|nr:energy-coupling factor transporter transmembrane component T [Macrococcus hajekii]TDM01944.1 energy-coupling factor transporter transmembrane protein EcfT [Macrococcus hajekii]GGB08736.1 cobalt ABC transporter permease [Macrococcus hajekii]